MIPVPDFQTRQDNLWRFYRGRSMLAIFRPGDYLVLEATPFEQIGPGDVVVFHAQEAGDNTDAVVHRVIAVFSEGLRTRGDTNLRCDAKLVTQEMFLGRVVALERGGRRCKVWGGRWGAWQARLIVTMRRLGGLAWRVLLPLGRLPWRMLRASRLPLLLWRPRIQRVRFATKDGIVVKYICNGRAVARWQPADGGANHRNSFRCVRPYDLILFRPKG